MAKKRGRKRWATENNLAAQTAPGLARLAVEPIRPSSAVADNVSLPDDDEQELEPSETRYAATGEREQPAERAARAVESAQSAAQPAATPAATPSATSGATPAAQPAATQSAQPAASRPGDTAAASKRFADGLPTPSAASANGWKNPVDYFAGSAALGAGALSEEILQSPSDDHGHADMEEFLEQVDLARHNGDFALIEKAALKLVQERNLLKTEKPNFPSINMAEMVADRSAPGTKQAAGSSKSKPVSKERADSRTSAKAERAADWGDSGADWFSTNQIADKEIQVEPLSEKSTKFIESLRESIINAGVTESIIKVETAELMDRDSQLSGEWRPVDGQTEEDVLERPVLPPASARRKQSIEVPKVTLEERLVGENITAREIEEEEKFRLQRLKDKTTGGQYHFYLLIYVACIFLAYAAQNLTGPDMKTAFSTAGKSVATSVDRLMLPNTFATFANGVKYYEDEASKGLTKKFNFFSTVGTGIGAAVKVSTTDASGSFSPKRKGWYQLPTGFFFGFPAAALYTVRQIVTTAFANKSALELVLIGLIYLAMIGMAGMIYMRAQRRWPIFPVAAAPIVILILVSFTSMLVSAVITFSTSLCRTLMPDTIQLFSALAVIGIAGLASRLAFFGPKAKTSVRH